MRKKVASRNDRNRQEGEDDPFPPFHRERRLSFRRNSTTVNENPPPQRPPPRLRFNSLTSNYTPYLSTVGTRQPPSRMLNAEKKDSESFLLRMIENLKEGILSQMDSQMTELRASIPQMVRELISTNQLPQQSQTNLNPYNPHHQQVLSHMIPQTQYYPVQYNQNFSPLA